MVAPAPGIAAFDLLRWIVLIPLMGSAINLFFGRAFGKKAAGALACAAVGAPFALACYIFWQLPARRNLSRYRLHVGSTPAPFKRIFRSRSTHSAP